MSVPEATKWVCELTLPIATQPLDWESSKICRVLHPPNGGCLENSIGQ